MLVTIEINMDEDEYRKAVEKGYFQHYCEKPESDLGLDDIDDFARAVPHMLLDDSNTTINIL